MKNVAAPGFEAGDLSHSGNLAAYIDNLLLKGHLYTENWDPEGLLHTLPAIGGCLLGSLAGAWIRSGRSETEKIAGLAIAGNALMVLAYICNQWFPINKNLWSPSFVFLTVGMGMCVLATGMWIIDYKGIKWWTGPFFALGMNPLFAYLLSGFVWGLLAQPNVKQLGGPCESYKGQSACRTWQGCVWDQGRNKCVTPGVSCKLFRQERLCRQMDDCKWNNERRRCVDVRDGRIGLREWIYQNFYARWFEAKKASLFYSMTFVAFWMGITGLMYKFRIIIRI